MKLVVPKEIHPQETRVPLVPDTVKKLVQQGADIEIESGMGESCFYTDADYEAAGAKINKDRKNLLQTGDVVRGIISMLIAVTFC